jgi:hypothetical protein
VIFMPQTPCQTKSILSLHADAKRTQRVTTPFSVKCYVATQGTVASTRSSASGAMSNTKTVDEYAKRTGHPQNISQLGVTSQRWGSRAEGSQKNRRHTSSANSRNEPNTPQSIY